MSEFKHIYEHLPARKSERLSMEEFKTRIGSCITRSLPEALRECKRLNRPIVYEHNGREIVIHPTQTIEQVFQQFDRNQIHARQ